MVIMPDERVGVGKGEPLTLCLAAAYVKQMRLFYAVYRLCEKGLGEESNLQVRAMFELYVRLRYLVAKAPDKDEFSRRWMMWAMANDKKFIDAMEKYFPGKPDPRFNLWKELVKKESEKMTPDEWKAFVRDGPWGCNLADLSEKVESEGNYRVMYPFLSGTTHGYDLFRYARRKGEEATELDITPTVRCADQNLVAAMSLLHDSLILINVGLGLGKEKPIEDVGKLVKALTVERTPPPM